MKNQPVTTLSILHLTDGNHGGSQRYMIDLCRSGNPGIRHFVLRAGTGLVSLHDPARDRVLVLAAPPATEHIATTLAAAIAELGIGCVHAHALSPLLAAAESKTTHAKRMIRGSFSTDALL